MRKIAPMTVFVYVLLCLIWGSTWMAIKIGLDDLPPLWASTLRFALAVLVLYSLVLARRLRLPRALGGWLRLGYPGLYMYGASYALVYMAEQRISSALTAVLFASFPIFVAVLSAWLLREERLRRKGWLGLLLGLAGVVLISLDSLQGSTSLFVGTILALGGSLASAYGVVIHKKHFASEDIVVTAVVQMTVGLVPMLVAALVLERFADVNMTLPAIGSILYLTILGTIVAFLGYYWLLKRMQAVAVALVAFITPLVAILIGVVGFGESFAVAHVGGTLLILCGVALVVRRPEPAGGLQPADTASK